MPREVAIVIVNFNSGQFLAGCIASLAPARQGGVEADVVVVENASPLDQERHLEGACRLGARVLRRYHNDGYAGGCNHGLAATDSRFVFFLNADVEVGAGCVPTLLARLNARPSVGIVEPRCYIDAGRQWCQPSFVPLTPGRVVGATLARCSRTLAWRRGLRDLRRQIGSWQSTAPHECAALSGAFLATRRDVMERVRGFDTGYPLAYEDTDLFRRVHAAGFALEVVPGADAIHYAHRSRITVLEDSLRKDELGRRRYLRVHHGRWAEGLDRLCARLETAWRRVHDPRPGVPFLDLGGQESPVELALSGPAADFVLQLAYDPAFTVYAGHIGRGASYRWPPESWNSLLAAPIYVRAFGLARLELRGAWVVRRVVRAGQEPTSV